MKSRIQEKNFTLSLQCESLKRNYVHGKLCKDEKRKSIPISVIINFHKPNCRFPIKKKIMENDVPVYLRLKQKRFLLLEDAIGYLVYWSGLFNCQTMEIKLQPK